VPLNRKGHPLSDTRIRIDRRQRQSLYGLLLQRLSGIDDPGLMVERGDFAAAERFGNEFAADVRLLNDLGWDPGDGRETFAITVPAEDFLGTLRQLRVDAEGGVDEPEEVRCGREEDNEVLARHCLARDICVELIASLEPGRDDS
jgi:hypothetical protein